MTDYPVTMDQGVSVSRVDTLTCVYRLSQNNTIKFDISNQLFAAARTKPVALSQGVGAHDAASLAWHLGATVAEIIRASIVISPQLKYTVATINVVRIHDLLANAIPASLSGLVSVNAVIAAAQGTLILEHIGIANASASSAHYHTVLAQLLQLNSAAAHFLGCDLSETVGVHVSAGYKYVSYPVLTQGVGLHDVLGHALLLRVDSDEHIGISASDVLRVVYTNTLAEGVVISAAYVSPGGNFTTWVVNTRTRATTEYTNWTFNSFAKIGVKYLGANSDGLYELVGDTDAGENIVSDIKSGLVQLGGSRFTGFKSAYLGMRGTGDFVLRIITDEDETRDYAVVANDMRTAKVNLGKGLRSRYFAFELVSTGQDFDLDSVEFVPIVNQRRV